MKLVFSRLTLRQLAGAAAVCSAWRALVTEQLALATVLDLAQMGPWRHSTVAQARGSRHGVRRGWEGARAARALRAAARPPQPCNARRVLHRHGRTRRAILLGLVGRRATGKYSALLHP